MRLLKITAPMTALILLTGACGPSTKTAAPKPTPSDPVPAVSPAAGPALKRVWQVPNTEFGAGFRGNLALGNVVLGRAEGNDKETLFIDGKTGRITGRAASSFSSDTAAAAATDARGRPVVVVNTRPKLSVYDTNGRLLGRAPGDYSLYAGGYYMRYKAKSGLVIRTLSGHQVARLPRPRHPGPWAPPHATLQAVRPGLLVASNYGAGRSQVALIDVSKPGKSRVHPLSAPPEADSVQVGVETAVADGHMYVTWSAAGGKRTAVARYNAPVTRPAWHVRLPAEIDAFAKIEAYPGANDTITILNNSGDGFWFLRPDTGSLVAPKASEDSKDTHIVGVAGGHVYAKDEADFEDPKTKVIDPRTGAVVRTIDTDVLGITTNGTLIDVDRGFTGYRWG